MNPACLGLALGLLAIQDDGQSIAIADLPDYRAALEDPSDEPGESVPFRDLWDHPDDYKGRRIRVEGTVARRFRQASVGMFPPLTELWVVSASRDPFCLVFPTPDDADEARATEVGASIRFDGLFLKPIRYPAGDEPRVAPLIVGSRSPVPHATDPLAGQPPRSPFSAVDWIVGLVVGGLAALLLLRHALKRPARPRRRASSAPTFVDSDDTDDRTEGRDAGPIA
ncbi:MAG: hypothetical protein U0800_00205 [Isosphaeraceae bacterium]